jgi:hypothetical protein
VDNNATRGKIWTLDKTHQVFDVDIVQVFPVLQHIVQRVHHLAQVVRRDAGGHSDRNPGGAVDQHVRNSCWEHIRFRERAIEILDEIDRVLANVR